MNSGEMRIAVVDDNAADRRLLEGYLEKYRKEKECSFTVVPYENSIEFLESYGQGYDVVFLDIEMPGMNGLETAEELRKADDSVGIIFITNMAQYAIRGYEVNAIDFMVKPVGYYNFSLKLEKALDFAEKKQMKIVTVATRDQIVRLTQQQVWYVEKDKNYVIYHTEKGTYKARGTMQEVKEKLDSFLFAECMTGCLVNLQYVEEVGKDSVQIKDAQLPVSRRMRKDFMQHFMDYLGGTL